MDNNNTIGDIALDPSKMAPQDGSPLVQTGSTQPAVLDITPRDNPTLDALSTPLAPVTPIAPIAPIEPVAPVVVTPAPDPLNAPATPTMSTPGGSLADIISASNQVIDISPVSPVSPLAPVTPIAPIAPIEPVAPVVVTPAPDPLNAPATSSMPAAPAPSMVAPPNPEQNPLAEDPNVVNTIG